MVIHVKKKASKKKLDNALKKLASQKRGVDLTKYAGKVDFGIDGLSYQKELRKND